MARVEFEFKVSETETDKNLLVTVCKLDFRRERDIELHLEIPYYLVSGLLAAKSQEQFLRILKVSRFIETKGDRRSISGMTNIEINLNCTEVRFFTAMSNRRPWVRLTLGWFFGVFLKFEFQGFGRTTGEMFQLRGASEKIPRPDVIAFVYNQRLEIANDEDDDDYVDPSVEYERTFPSSSEGPPWIYGDYDDDYKEEQGPCFEFDGVDRHSYFVLQNPLNVENYHEALDRFENSFIVRFLSAF